MIFERSDGRIKDCEVPGSAAQEEISLMNDLDDHDRTKGVARSCSHHKLQVVCSRMPRPSRFTGRLREGQASPDLEWQFLQDRLQTINSQLKSFALSLDCCIHPSHRSSQSISASGTDLDCDTPLRPSRAPLGLAREASAEVQ
jgi:hypothetical protein